MKNKSYILNTALVTILTVALVVAVLIRTFAPNVIIPILNVPNIVLLSLTALLVDHYIAKGAKRCYICTAVFSALCFGLLPLAAGFAPPAQAWKLALAGGVIFTLVTFLFSSIQERLSSGPAAKSAPLLSALGLYLAFQIFSGMIL